MIKTVTIQQAYDIINISIASSQIQELKTPYATIRPSLHTITVGRIGSMKSSILHEVCDQFETTPTFNLSSANILGSVDKTTGIPIHPTVWECRNSIMPIDEFYVDTFSKSQRHALSVFLSVLEKPSFQKKIAYRVNDYEEKDGDLFCIMKNGTIKVKSRFTLIANTMQPLQKKQRMIELEALKTRCLLIPYYPDVSEIKSMIQGKNMYKYKKYKVKKKVKINKKDFDKIIDLVDQHKISVENYARTIGDLCRVYAVIGLNLEMLKLICDMKEGVNKRE